MGATGFVILVICGLRIVVDDPKYLPMPQAAKWKWGLSILAGIGLVIASIAKMLWEFMP